METAGTGQGRLDAEQRMLDAKDDADKLNETYSGTLTTDDRVLARVTDGIYRQPGSALREMISNAWDADASTVYVTTDAPRFNEITIADDGNGMSWRTLARTLHHIGGSAKRQKAGAELGVTDPDVYDRSPGGRPLIGKIGIGLFSVAQLTRSFQIVTKETGSSYWNVASVRLHTHSDTLASRDDSENYEAGKFEVWRESTVEADAHGTTIILDGIWPQTVQTLRSADFWSRYDEAVKQGDSGTLPKPPRYNIGGVISDSPDQLRKVGQNLPWEAGSPSNHKMQSFLGTLQDAYVRGVENNPRVSGMCDYYLQMLWQLSNWSPLEYIDQNPFRLTRDSDFRFFAIRQGKAEELKPDREESVGDLLPFDFDVKEKNFHVELDGVELKRPISFEKISYTSAAMQTPLMFYGGGHTTFGEVDERLSGGPLRFYAYFQWAPKIVPTENRGLLVRVRGASGKDYDPTFLDFPVSEQRRLEQISCEVFVTEGFDGALNIDRESFNSSHPHVVYLTRWIHSQLRVVIAKQKQLGRQKRESRKLSDAESVSTKIDAIVSQVRENRPGGVDADPISVSFSETAGGLAESRATYIFSKNKVLGRHAESSRGREVSLKLGGIVELLDLFGLVNDMSASEVEELLSGIRQVLTLEVDE